MRAFLSALAIVPAIAILAFFQWTTPTYALLTGPLEVDGHQSENLSAGPFDVKVDRVLLSKTLAFDHFGRPVERQTEGVWVVVTAEMQTQWQTMRVGAAALQGASGRTYMQSTRLSGAKSLLTDKDLQPGLPAKGIFVFEMPEQDAHGMSLILSRQLGPRLDSEAHVRLDSANVERKDRVEIRNDGV
jgi:hypothetical protein